LSFYVVTEHKLNGNSKYRPETWLILGFYSASGEDESILLQ